MDIVIIGSGNVASVLGRKIKASGHNVLQIAARNSSKAEILARELECEFTSELSGINRHATLYIVAISDDALHTLYTRLKLDHAIIVHTAGSVSREILKEISTNYGVLYPLQTLRAESQQIPPMPILVDGNTADSLTMITDFAETLSDTVVHANDLYRKKIHMAAVISGNFSNHLFALVQDYCQRNQLDFSLLLPQINEIVKNLSYGEAVSKQTGPAIRNDVKTLNSHRQMMDDFPRIADLYEKFTASIQQYHQERSS